ncbi:hypothetical protein KKB55_05105 [Myxococcota bacterium]|nr:hypothetical protein [Myxococcota bacterium]MBU1897132.1 hypothetical protein [Myxococcota bacterium]
MSTNLRTLLASAPRLDRAVEGAMDGSVLGLVGALDGESAAAVTILAEDYLAEIGELMGLGEPTAWSVSGARSCYYIVHGARSFAVVLGAPTKSPGRVLERLIERWV